MVDNFMNEAVVEEAPEEIDLDALLGLDEGELEANVGNTVGNSTVGKHKSGNRIFKVMTQDDEEVSEPHIKIPTSKLVEVLAVSSLLSSAGENSFEGKVVCISVEDGVARFLLSDNKRNIEKRVDLLNKENQFTGFIAFSSSLLNKMSKVCTSVTTIIQRKEVKGDKETDKYVLKIRGGEVVLDNINMDKNKFDKTIDCKNGKEYKKIEIIESIKRLYAYASTSIRSGKSIDFNGDYIQTSPINGLAKIKTEKSYPTFRMTLTDTKILSVLSYKDSNDFIKISKDGKEFIGDTYKFKTESYSVTKPTYDSVVERMFEGESVEIDANHLKKLVELSCGLDTSVGNLKFNYTDDGLVSCRLLTKREDSDLVIQGNPNTNVVKLDNPIELYSFNLKGALTVFNNEDSLNMRVSPDGVSLESGDVRVALLGKSNK